MLAVSKSHTGRIHDFSYQGWQKLQSEVVISFKKSKKQALSKEKKEHNRRLACFRMKVENTIREIRIFKIMGETYGNFQKKYNMSYNIIARVVNLKRSF